MGTFGPEDFPLFMVTGSHGGMVSMTISFLARSFSAVTLPQGISSSPAEGWSSTGPHRSCDEPKCFP